jgi:hypothetical protein
MVDWRSFISSAASSTWSNALKTESPNTKTRADSTARADPAAVTGAADTLLARLGLPAHNTASERMHHVRSFLAYFTPVSVTI